MSATDYLTEQLDHLQVVADDGILSAAKLEARNKFGSLGIPTVRNEEWKYTRIGSVLNKEYKMGAGTGMPAINKLPGTEYAHELVFINGVYSKDHSVIRSEELLVLPLEEAAKGSFKSIVDQHFNHSAAYMKDGMHALNTAGMSGAVFVHVPDRKVLEHPLYIYNVADTTAVPVLAQPRTLFYIGNQAELSITETYITTGASDSMTNQVMEMIVEQDANVSYYKIQNDQEHAHQNSTMHIRQIGKCTVTVVTISLNGGMVRNNLHAVLEAPYAEAHMYGLYLQKGNSHIDNHTIMDHAVPNCPSNELYKGILDGNATGVFNGKIFVRKDAQKTNAFQSNKNILLSEQASVNTKPQLEIYADDVKCSHGCTVGSLDQEGLFYLQSRGIPRERAMALLLQGFAVDVLEQVRSEAIRHYIEELILERLSPAQ
jgi:Fe-S cluster assembly protein SufD